MNHIFAGKKIIIGVSGSIAAYKTPLLVRELMKSGATVKVLMTPSAKNFVSPLVLANLSQNPVWIEMFDENAQKDGAWHIHTAHDCHAMIIAPCSATTLGKLANGICDNALVAIATALPNNVPLLIAPAMDFTMLDNPATQRNINQLKDWGATIIPPDEGELSSGLYGRGRLPEISVLMDYLKNALTNKLNKNNSEKVIKEKLKEVYSKPVNKFNDDNEKIKWQAEYELQVLKNKLDISQLNILKNKRVIITAGPTIEKIDEVRFISNFSSGKMGYAIAETCRNAGMLVTLISGQVSLPKIDGINTLYVESAQEMYDKTIGFKDAYDIAILSAAVADFTPKIKFDGKIKKESGLDSMTIELEKTKDILGELGKIKKENQILIGFALEYDNELENAKKKLNSKNCNLLVLNSSSKPDSGFGGDNNTITILDNVGKVEELQTMSKKDCSIVILSSILKYLEN
jgi:phosphopantothenoylcysteine decarboxylase/phosphopantothenate--cysteine ligase